MTTQNKTVLEWVEERREDLEEPSAEHGYTVYQQNLQLRQKRCRDKMPLALEMLTKCLEYIEEVCGHAEEHFDQRAEIQEELEKMVNR